MERGYYLQLAGSGHRVPIGTDLVLRDHVDPESILVDGQRLGAVVVEAARRYRTPLAIPLMDLTIEKTALLEMLYVPQQEIPRYHLRVWPGDDLFDALDQHMQTHRNARLDATTAAITHVAAEPDLLPIGMVIGPLSLVVKLLEDPIAALFAAGRGKTDNDDPRVELLSNALELATRIVLWSASRQIAAGAKAIMVCEPAASTAYISPRQIAAGADVLDRFVARPHARLKAQLDESGCDLIFHCCGEVTPEFIRRFAALEPAILSLGSSRNLWEDAALVPKTTVLYGNLPSRSFYSDVEMPVDVVRERARALAARMRAAGHPFILGTECDVLSVPGAHETIKAKVAAMISDADDPGRDVA